MSTFLQLMESDDWTGYRAAHGFDSMEYLEALDRCVALLENRDGLPAHRWAYELREAMSSDDFPNLFGDSLSRELVSQYKATDPGIKRLFRSRTVQDMRTITTIKKGGLLTSRLQEVGEGGEYLASQATETPITYALKKYGRQVPFSWEAYINDDLGMFSDIAADLNQAVINTENYHLTSLLFDADGPIEDSFGNGTSLATDPLSIESLETAYEAMLAYLHPDSSEPIMNYPKILMVPPVLELTARSIVTSTMKMWTDDAGPTAFPTTNVIAGLGMEVLVNPWIPVINTTSGSTCWALFSDPAQLPIGEFAHLRGQEQPTIWMKAPDAVAVGGAAVGGFSGDFATDTISYRVRHVMQGVVTEPRAGYASTGAGS